MASAADTKFVLSESIKLTEVAIDLPPIQPCIVSVGANGGKELVTSLHLSAENNKI